MPPSRTEKAFAQALTTRRVGIWQAAHHSGSETDHNVRETLSVTDRAYIINNGKIFRTGSPDDLAQDTEVKRVYLGESFSFNWPQ